MSGPGVMSGPLLPGGDGRKDTGRYGTGRIFSKARFRPSGPSMRREGCWCVARFGGRLPLREPLVGCGEMGLGVSFVERLRGSMGIVKRREMREATSRQWQGVYTMWPRGRHSANTRILALVRVISDTACFPQDTDLRMTSSTDKGDRKQFCCSAAAAIIEVEDFMMPRSKSLESIVLR
jgi:hypothetical protein